MTRKDYISFARFFRDHYILSQQLDNSRVIEPVLTAMIGDFMELLKTDNSRFDEVKFQKAVFDGQANII